MKLGTPYYSILTFGNILLIYYSLSPTQLRFRFL